MQNREQNQMVIETTHSSLLWESFQHTQLLQVLSTNAVWKEWMKYDFIDLHDL